MGSTTWRARWRWRRAILRTALALGLALTGSAGLSPDAQAAHGVTDKLWPRRPMRFGTGGCRVAYQLEGVITWPVYDTINQVIGYINATTPCVWEQKQWWESDYVAITENDWGPAWFFDLAASSGGTGMWGGRQEMSICHGCNDFQLVLHELGHSMGLLHEQQRPDRYLLVDAYYDRIQDEAKDQFYPLFYGSYLGLPYDTSSVMHYKKTSFLSGWLWEPLTALIMCGTYPCRTMELRSNPSADLGGTYFTNTDLKALSRLYPMPNQLVAMHSGKCVDIPGGNGSPGVPVQQFGCHEGANQGWLLRWSETVGGTDYYLLESADPAAADRCLDVQWASQNPGAPVILWPCHGGQSQQWSVVPVGGLNTGYYVRARHSGQCLDVAWASQDNGAGIVQSTCWGGANQIWGKNFRPEVRTREQPDPRCGNPRDPC